MRDRHTRLPEEILQRIERLRAMTTSPNINEAAVAAAKLQSLLLKHDLTMAEVGAPQRRSTAFVSESREFDTASDWRGMLLNVLARYNSCRAIGDAQTARLTLVGRPENVETVWFLHHWLESEIVRLCEETWRNTLTDQATNAVRWRNAFCCGAIETIAWKLKKQRRADLWRHRGSTALVLRDKEELDEAVSRLFPRLVAGRRTTSRMGVRAAEQAGRKAARAISLERRICDGEAIAGLPGGG